MLYGARDAWGRRPAVETMLMMLPPRPCDRKHRLAAWLASQLPLAITFQQASKSSIVISWTSARPRKTHALSTRMSRPPNRSVAVCSRRSTSGALVTSQCTLLPLPCDWVISSEALHAADGALSVRCWGWEACTIVAGRAVEVERLDVAFNRIESMGVENRGGPLVLRGSEGLAALRRLQRALGAAMKDAGLGPYVRTSFKPHVTLLYDDRYVGSRAVDPVGWTVTEFDLLHSIIGKSKHVELGGGRSGRSSSGSMVGESQGEHR